MEPIGPWGDWMCERLVGMRPDDPPAWEARYYALAPLATGVLDVAGVAPPWDLIDARGRGLPLLAWNLASAAAAQTVDRQQGDPRCPPT